MTIAKISKKIRILISKDNMNGALKLLTNDVKLSFTTYRRDTTATEKKHHECESLHLKY